MNPVTSVHTAISGLGNSPSHGTSGMMSDGMSEPSSPESSFDASDLLSAAVDDDVTEQLVATGPIGIAAAAAIASGKKKKRPHQFETNPSIRKRQQTRLLRKLRATIEEYTTRIGQQAVILCCTPGKPNHSYNAFKVFGSQPLENVIKNCKGVILQDLEATLAEHIPQSNADTAALHELPPLAIDGLPTPVDKMTQAQLRTFIPEMLKYSTGRSKPGWGKMDCRPPWWPNDLPWANVRSDVRTEDDKKRVSWTEALKTIVKNCYKHHGREDLLYVFSDQPQQQLTPQQAAAQYAGTMVQTINNPDGTVSIIQIDTGHSTVVTLPDGTQATVVQAVPDNPQQEANQAVQTLAEVAANHSQDGIGITPVSVELNADSTEAHVAHLSEDGRIIMTGDISGDANNGIVTIPVSLYQTMTSASTVAGMDNSEHRTIQITMAPTDMDKDDHLTSLDHEDSDSTLQIETIEPKIEPS
ncbi:hypothetical protein ScPMuIL_007575 [Solemya velum]